MSERSGTAVTLRRPFLFLAAATLLLGAAAAQQPHTTGKAQAGDPVLRHRSAPRANAPESSHQLHLDAIAEDAEGAPVVGLQPWDFRLKIDDRPTKILYFQSFDGVRTRPNPPVEVLLVIDELNTNPAQAAFVREEVEDYLRRLGARAIHPTRVFLLNDSGLQMQSRLSTNGKQLLQLVKHIAPRIGHLNPAMGDQGSLEEFQISMRAIENIVENEVTDRARKVLVWIGPGWPLLVGRQFVDPSERDRQRYFDQIVELTNRLRQARIQVNSVSVSQTVAIEAGLREMRYQDFLKGVHSPVGASAGNLGLKVLASNTGGHVIGPDNDLVSQISQCVAHASTFYEFWFEPPHSGTRDIYHAIRVEVDRPGTIVKTNAGFYEERPEDDAAGVRAP